MPRAGREQVVVGVDGCAGGWIAVTAIGGRFAALARHPDIASLVAATPQAAAFGVDIPLSFPAGTDWRATDREAQKLLGRFSSSLFPVPPRAVLETEPYAAANALSKADFGRGVSRQSYALRSKILEAVEFVAARGEERLFEVHPELSFRLLAESLGRTVTSGKKTWNGAAQRHALLEAVGLAPPFEPTSELGTAAVDDVLDAAAAAWTAHRIATGTAIAVGSAAGSARGAARWDVIHA